MDQQNKNALTKIFERVKENVDALESFLCVSLSQAKPPSKPGVYMVYFEGKLQYIGSSKNLKKRIK